MRVLSMRGFVVGVVLLLVAGMQIGFGAEATQRYWVYLQPKPITESVLLQAERQFTERAAARRRKNGVARADEYDVAVNANALALLRASGVHVRQVSRWLNAVSVEATTEQAEHLKSLWCVARVEPFHLRRTAMEVHEERDERALDDPVYGPSLTQNALCRVPELHARGLSGAGVIIGFLDTGWNRHHDAFAHMNVLATYDFIWHDTIVVNERGEDSLNQDLHGTATLSVCGGYADSMLIGPAYGATFVVAKTEWVWGEERSEEDNYVAALEWADSLGADITSSSLGYTDWYDYDDLDGHTAVTTQAAVIAQRRGILVVTSAGNNRGTDWNYISTPADADSILAVGAVDSAGMLSSFSSGGPTADGRTKPDVCAMGDHVFCAHREDPHRYFAISGTSLSAPLISGIAALIMEAHPDWTAQDVRTAMMATAAQAETPDNDYGWGVVDAVRAADYELAAREHPAPSLPQTLSLQSIFPQPVNGSVTVRLQLAQRSAAMVRIYDVLGRIVQELPERELQAGANEWRVDVSTLSSGTYQVEVRTASAVASGRITVLK